MTEQKKPEMEFLNRIFKSWFLGINSGLLRLDFFVWFSTLIFPFYKMQFINKLQFSCFADFLEGFLKPEKSVFSFKSTGGAPVSLKKIFRL